jgi:hypothetical protein
MGYCMDHLCSHFFISADDKEGAFAALVSFMSKTDKNKERLTWVHPVNVMTARTFEEAMAICRWTPEVADNGDICDINFNGQKIGSEQEIFQVIAPFVKDGSYIEMRGEDGTQWRWIFEEGKVREEEALITYSNDNVLTSYTREDYELKPEHFDDGCWITVGDVSIRICKGKETLFISAYVKNVEDDDGALLMHEEIHDADVKERYHQLENKKAQDAIDTSGGVKEAGGEGDTEARG